MRNTIRAATLVLLCAATPALAQDHRHAAGFNAGGIYFTPFNPSPTGLEGGSAADLALDPSWTVGLQAERWWGSGRVGGRINGALGQSPFSAPDRPTRDIGYWLADAALLLRFLPAEPGRSVAPFISAGAGVVKYRLGSGEPVQFPGAGAVFHGDDRVLFAVTGGLGFDIRTPLSWDGEPIFVRLEGTDHVALESPFREPDTGDRYGVVHNARVTLGLFTGFGLLR